VLTEALVGSPALQTASPETQALERRLRRLWRLQHSAGAGVRKEALAAELEDVARGLRALSTDYADWEIVYRQTLQVARALAGRAPLLDPGADDASRARDVAASKRRRALHRRLLAAAPTLGLEALRFFGKRRRRV
jgi:hypothetical protein